MLQVIVTERGECMKVGELIQLLQAFDPEMKVLMARSDTSLEDVVACYDELVCEGRVSIMTEVRPQDLRGSEGVENYCVSPQGL